MMQRLVDLLRDKMRMVGEDALAVAHVVQDAFRGADEVEDDDLEPQLRQLFYDLQDAKVLDVKRREYRNDEGRLLRGYKWHLLDNEITRDVEPTPEPDPVEDLYRGLGRQAWERRRPEDRRTDGPSHRPDLL